MQMGHLPAPWPGTEATDTKNADACPHMASLPASLHLLQPPALPSPGFVPGEGQYCSGSLGVHCEGHKLLLQLSFQPGEQDP